MQEKKQLFFNFFRALNSNLQPEKFHQIEFLKYKMLLLKYTAYQFFKISAFLSEQF